MREDEVEPEVAARLRRLQARQDDVVEISGRILTCKTCKCMGGHLPRCPHWVPPRVAKKMACKTCGLRGRHHDRCPVKLSGGASMVMMDEGQSARAREVEARLRREGSG
jgi:hypothetical protein